MMDKINELRKDFGLSNETNMVIMLSISTNDMNRYVAMYPEVWFIDCTAGMLFKSLCEIFIMHIRIEISIWHALTGTDWQKKQLFVMAVHTPSGTTLPGNLTIVPSNQKWVFQAIYQLVFPHLYSSEVCSRNRLVLMDEDDTEYKSFDLLKQ